MFDLLFVICLNDFGGAEISMINVAQGFAQRGYRVAVAVYGSRCDLLASGQDGLHIIQLGATRTLGALRPLRDVIGKGRPAVVISALTHTNIMAVVAARTARISPKVVVTEHSQIPLFPEGKECNGLKSIVLRWLARQAYTYADAVVGVSKGVSGALKQMGISSPKVRTIYNPVTVKLSLSDIPAPHDWLQNKDRPIIMGVGRLGTEKNFALLIHAFARVLANRPARLIILGEGNERPVLMRLIAQLQLEDHVLMPGFVSNVGAWLQHASVFVCPSRVEGFGNAIVEALAAGLTVVSTDCPHGPDEILDHGRFGRLVPMDKPDAMAAAIEEALDHPSDPEISRQRASLFGEGPCLDAYTALVATLRDVRAEKWAWLERLHRRLSAILLHESWMIGVIDEPIENAVRWTSCPSVRWIGSRDKGRYLADPFAWPDSQHVVLCEDYDYETKQGSIIRLELQGTNIVSETPVNFSLPGHLSFPFLFKKDGVVYALPESAVARRLVLLRWDEAAQLWSPLATPLADTAAADSVLFEHKGRFWIAYTDVDTDRFDNLNLLYADRLEGPWIPHKNNPVIRQSPSSARCAGTPFRVGEKLYRPAQDCAADYGGAIRLMEILECTPDSFKESEANLILPERGINPDGLHTLSAWGDKCLVDGKRMMFSPRLVGEKILRRLKKIYNRA